MASSGNLKTIVLVVEDEPVLRMNAVDMVEDAGFDCIEAANAKQAMELLEARTDIAIILSDISMPPGMDGTELVAIVRDRWPPIKIILLSGQFALGDVELPEGGMFFSKPYRSEAVIAAMNQLVA